MVSGGSHSPLAPFSSASKSERRSKARGRQTIHMHCAVTWPVGSSRSVTGSRGSQRHQGGWGRQVILTHHVAACHSTATGKPRQWDRVGRRCVGIASLPPVPLPPSAAGATARASHKPPVSQAAVQCIWITCLLPLAADSTCCRCHRMSLP